MSFPKGKRGGRAGRRKLLLVGLAIAAIGMAYGTGLRAHAAGVLSSQTGSAIAPVTSSVTANLLAQQQAQDVAAQAQDQLSRITTALQALQTMQTAAHNGALTAPSSVADGLQTGGLVPDSGLASAGVANPVTTWTGANTPTQTSSGGQTTVTINQTAAQAILSWNSFNVSPKTTVNFNQQGNTDWVALNKIAASGTPSQILGSIKASGQVYLIDPNGIIFGASSQVNVGALIASSAEIGDSQFLSNGIYSTETGTGSQAVYAPSFTKAGGAITVDEGAEIGASGPASVTNGGGFVLLMGTQVSNAGSISTPQGQTELAAGDNFILRTGVSTSSNTTSTTAGNEIAVELDTPGSSVNPGGSGSGLVVNTGTGLITADTGDITLAGETIDQDGMLYATTSTAYRGTIHLLTSASDPYSSVTLGTNGYTLIEPDLASTATELDGQRTALIADSATANAERGAAFNQQFDDLSLLADEQGESRIEIVTGGTVEFQNGSDSSTPGGQIAVSAVSRIEADTGATIDASGSYAVPMAMSSNDILVNIQADELRDDPQNRLTGALDNANVYVDASTLSLVPASAAYSSDRDYTSGGLLEVSGELANVGHTIGEYTAIGGSIDLSTGADGAVVAQTGSTFNIDGGSLQYQSGYLKQSYVVASNGQIYNVNNAPSNITYTGVYDGFTVDHAVWGVTQTYASGLNTPSSIYEPGYTVGRAAGSLTVSSPTTVFDGSIEAGTVNGALQTNADPAGVTDPYTLTQNEVAEAGSLNIGTLSATGLLPGDTDVGFASSAPDAGSLTTPIAADVTGTSIFNAGAIDDFGLGGLDVITNGSIDISAPLVFAPGAAISLYGSSVDIGADVTDPGGSVTAGQVATVNGTQYTLEASGGVTGDTVLAPDATISTAGLWTNIALDPSVTFTEAYINGGAVSLGSVNNLTLGAGSVIDTSAGGVISASGGTKGGAGGNITLAAATPSNDIPFPAGALTLGGTLDAIGVTKGGALSVSAPAFLISAAASRNPLVVSLDPAFFTQGFSAYNLTSTGNIAVAPGTLVNVTEPTYEFTPASQLAPTGTAPAAALTVALAPLYTPNSTYTAITQRAGASFSASIVSLTTGASVTNGPVLSIGAGAAINVDPGQAINLAATGQITIDGALSAPGGAISAVSDFNTFAALPGGAGTVSVWVGQGSVIDASAAPVTFTDTAGGMISLAPAGGKITLGSKASTAAVVIQQGAVVEASGSAAADEVVASSTDGGETTAVPAGQPIAVEGAGGAISLASQEGIYNDGALIAEAGGPDAAGGSLSMTIEADQVLSSGGIELTPRIFTITQDDPGPLLPPDLQPGETSSAQVAGTAQISAQQIAEGGFGSVTLYTRDAFEFQGNVTLKAAQSISLEEGYITDSSPSGVVALDAPYVLLSGQTPDINVNGSSLAAISGFSGQAGAGTFTVNAALIDVASEVRFGGVLPAAGSTAAVDLAGFATVNLNSSGDLRFDAPNTSDAGAVTNIVTTANLNLTAREIYAQDSSNSITGTSALIVAGYDPHGSAGNGGFNPDGVLTIARTAGTTPVAPDEIGGSLTFEAATINQGGAILQPLGSLTFGGINEFIGDGVGGGGDPNTVVNFLAGGITSVSAAGLTIPFGGTTDGVTYDVDGQAVASKTSATFGLQGVTNGAGPGTITIAALTTDVQKGATLDLQGGGTLTGAGFISGEGGSSDALTTPLLKVGSGTVSQPALASDPVYAIVAGPQPVQAVAYTASGATGSAPALGAQIVIPAGVPGLPAGTYTLLPAQYALTPGGYRVEFDGAASLTANTVTQLPNGSYAVAGFTAVANTNVQNTLASNLTITPGATVLNYSQYDQESYSQFLIATATRLGGIRPALPIDAGNLVLNLPANAAASLTNAGTTLFQAATGGEGGTLTIAGAGFSTPPSLDIFGAAPAAGLPAGTVSLSAAQIDSFDATTIELGDAGAGFNAATNAVTLENGATLTAARVVITALGGGITLNDGSEIDTLGQGTLLADSTTFGLFSNGGASVLDVANGYLSYNSAPALFSNYGPITVQDGATIYTDGSIAFSTSASVNIGVNAIYGGKYLDLAVPEINIGDPAALGANAPPGLVLTQAVLQTLTQGVPAIGVPALQTLVLTASDSLNLYGTTALDLTGSGVQLVINTPAIYGFGGASDVATISADTIVWNGISTLDVQSGETVSSLPGGAVANGPGSGTGTLDLDAKNIVFGYSDLDEPQRDVPLSRLTLGFSTVNVSGTTEITANNQGTLAVYASQPVYGQAGSGGTLNLTTPLLTAAADATIGFLAGGDIDVAPAAGVNPTQNLAGVAAGGEIDLTAGNIDPALQIDSPGSIAIASSVILPSGKLDLLATNDITLTSASLVNLAGVKTTIAKATTYGFGGNLVMQSADGNITQAAGSVIDVAATDNDAGSVTATATNTAGGQVALLGTLTGGSTNGYNSGSFTVSAQSVGDFAALNTSLDAGDFDQSRSFDIKQGDLTIGNGVRAHNVSVSVDGGSLNVTGLIDASGNGGGSISLAAADNLTIAGGAVLDAHGTVLQVDSNNQPIASENTPEISLTTSTGALTLDTGATFDLASADSTARGDLELNVPRLGSATSGDADIEAAGALNITGASTIALNAFWTYNGKPDPDGSVDGNSDAIIDQAYLDKINTDDSAPFMVHAAANTDLAARIAGLVTYGSNFHLRPGVQIVSATPDGDLTVQGDINLAGFRYNDPAGYGNRISYIEGSGEPGALVIRAGGNLNIYGSITDGFEKPVSDVGTEFAKGWVVYGGGEPYGQAQTIPTAITVAKGTSFAIGETPANFAIPITGGTFQAGAVAPVNLVVKGKQVTSVAFVATSNILAADGTTVLFAVGTVVPAGSVIPNKAVIDAGGTLPFNIDVGPVTWPANTPFTVTESLADGNTGVVLAQNMQLLAGSYIPAGSALKFVAGEAGLKVPTDPNGNRLYFPDGTPVPAVVETRPVNGGTQGQLYGLAALLPKGDLSWSISLIAGADTTAANPDIVQASSALASEGDAGDITLADTHYGQTTDLITIPPLHNPNNPKNHKICEKDPASCKPTYQVNYVSVVPAYSVVRTGTGSLSVIAGGSIDEDSAYGIYTAGAQSAAILVNGKNPYNLAQGYGTKSSLLGSGNTKLAALVADYEANYPTGGGNVLVSAQGNLNGFISTTFAPVNPDFYQSDVTDTDAVGGWLWRQGGAGEQGAWWIEYGSLDLTSGSGQNGAADIVQYTGFQGIGTLGGGNLTVDTGGNASRLNLVVASNGRVKTGGALVQNGGGSLDVTIGGALNFRPPGSFSPYVQDAGGMISDLRGDTILSAGSIGTILPQYGTVAGDDPRILAPLNSETADFGNGIDLLPGDGTVTVQTRGDLVIDGAGNPGTVQNTVNTTPVHDAKQHISRTSGGSTDFSLWTANTGIDLISAGGDVAPIESNAAGNGENANADDYYPPNLLVAAQSGNIYFGSAPVELAPSANGQLQLLAADSIIGDASIVSMSGAALSTVATPYDPGITVSELDGLPVYTNHNPNSPGLLVDFGADTPTGALHAGDAQPALVYAGAGDILDISFGEFLPASTTAPQQVVAAKPFDIVAGRDIVDSGTIDAPDTFLNLGSNDITSISAGRDIIESSFDIAGPGNLVVQAGRDIYLVDQIGANVPLADQGGTIDSIGPIFDIDPNDRNSGANVSVLAGVGADGPDYDNFANLYLNPASTLGLDDASDIITANDATLDTWLQTNYGYTGTAAGAYAYFLTLPAGPREVFLRELYYDELNNSGLEFNEPASVRYKSYILGQDAIAALFPSTDGNGQPLTYTGDITMSGDSGIHTEFGGNIETMTPGGQTIIGVEGTTPPASAGFITEGSGDIDIYALGSVLLGESRVLTTFGGNIVIWSAAGDINAGQGSKTTIDYTPLQRVYDNYGDVFLSPTVPSSGAGIATLNPIPSVPPGDIDLIAPLGTVNAGSAGIRVSGNINIAAQHVVNGSNIQVQGTSSGVPTATAPDIGAISGASGAAGAAAQSAENANGGTLAAPLPSIWIVEILGYGGPGQPAPGQCEQKKHGCVRTPA
jgi:filamentous hemagglutinin family protein